MESGPPCSLALLCSHALRDRPTLADERVALDVRPQGLGCIGTKLELEVNHLLKIDRGNTCSAGS